MDKIIIKKSTNQEGTESPQNLDPRKLIISCYPDGDSFYGDYYKNYNIRFGVYNRNLQQTKNFHMDGSVDYNLIDSTISYGQHKTGSKYQIKHSSNILYFYTFTQSKNTYCLKCKLSSTKSGEICCYGRTDFQELQFEVPVSIYNQVSDKISFNPGITDITLTSKQSPFAYVAVLNSSVNYEISDCYITVNNELDRYIEPKHQNIELEYKFISKKDFIKFDANTNKWINSNNESLSNNDQNILNNIEIYPDGCYFIPCCMEFYYPFCQFEYQE